MICFSLAAPFAATAQEGTGEPAEMQEPPVPDIDEVMSALDDLYRSHSSHTLMSMSVTTEHFSRTLELEGWTKGDEQSLIIIRSPAREAGTATLRTEQGLWNYAPRADRLMRIPSGLLSEAWMGSHFTNDDLMRDSAYDDDFDTTLQWVDEDGQRLLLAISVPHDDAAIVWSRIEFRLLADSWAPLRSDYYDGDELVRTMQFSNIQDIGGRPIPMIMELIPHTHPGESTRVEYQLLELDVEIDDGLFTQRGLRRAAQR
jgi:outer membrane lipoprotein-sorting protein